MRQPKMCNQINRRLARGVGRGVKLQFANGKDRYVALFGICS